MTRAMFGFPVLIARVSSLYSAATGIALASFR